MTTAPRDTPTVIQSLQSVKGAGWGNVTIFNDATLHGAWPTFRNGLATLVAHNPVADAYLMFQDDVKVAKNCREFLEQCLWQSERVGVVSLYTYYHNYREDPGWYPVARTWGALAYVFTPLTARELIAGTGTSDVAVDRQVGRFFRDAGLEYICHSPSLVQHTGETSTIHNSDFNQNRQAKVWCEDVDTLAY